MHFYDITCFKIVTLLLIFLPSFGNCTNQSLPISSGNIRPKTEKFDYEAIISTIRNRTSIKPNVLIITGSGLNFIGDLIENPVEIPYLEIPGFPISTVEGHKGVLILGQISGQNVICQQGRFHYYEGYTMQEITLGVRVAARLGAKYLFATNANGGINPKYKLGDLMVIKDHLFLPSFGGINPLRGLIEEKDGIRFPVMNTAYDKTLRNETIKIADRYNFSDIVHQGVYAMYGGPSFQTIAELRAFKLLGADALGMSTIPEVVVARSQNMTVFALSVVSSKEISKYEDLDQPAGNQDDFIKIVESRKNEINQIITRLTKIIRNEL